MNEDLKRRILMSLRDRTPEQIDEDPPRESKELVCLYEDGFIYTADDGKLFDVQMSGEGRLEGIVKPRITQKGLDYLAESS